MRQERARGRRGRETSPISRGFVLQNYHLSLVVLFPPFFLSSVHPLSGVLWNGPTPGSNERLISRVKLLAFTAAISTNLLARACTIVRCPLKIAYRFLYVSPPVPLTFRSGTRSYFRHEKLLQARLSFLLLFPAVGAEEPRARC